MEPLSSANWFYLVLFTICAFAKTSWNNIRSLQKRQSPHYRGCLHDDGNMVKIAVFDDLKQKQRLYSRCRAVKRCTVLMVAVINISVVTAIYLFCSNLSPLIYRRSMLWQWTPLFGNDDWKILRDDALPNCTRYRSTNHTLSETVGMEETESKWNDFNLVYIKAEKVGGSTVSGVVRGIAHKLKMHGAFGNVWPSTEPLLWACHKTYREMDATTNIGSLSKPTFLMSWIREPAERALSAFYHFEASRNGVAPTEKHILSHLSKGQRPLRFNHLTEYIKDSGNMTVPEIMGKYDFIGIQDRFAESMLVLAHRLGLEIEDMLYVKAKDSHHLKVDNRGYPLVPTVPLKGQSDAVKQYMENEWRVQNKADYELFDAVNSELDRQIAVIPDFEDKLQRYQCLLSRAEMQCGHLPNSKTDCYLNDQGCGRHCLRSIVD